MGVVVVLVVVVVVVVVGVETVAEEDGEGKDEAVEVVVEGYPLLLDMGFSESLCILGFLGVYCLLGLLFLYFLSLGGKCVLFVELGMCIRVEEEVLEVDC